MPEWISTDFGIAGLIICGLVYVIVTYLNKKSDAKCAPDRRCSDNFLPQFAESVKTNSELIVVLRNQQEEFRRHNEKQQEALQGLVLAINNLITLQHETLDRVKTLDNNRRNGI